MCMCKEKQNTCNKMTLLYNLCCSFFTSIFNVTLLYIVIYFTSEDDDCWFREGEKELGSFNNIIGKPFLIVLLLGTFFVGFFFVAVEESKMC